MTSRPDLASLTSSFPPGAGPLGLLSGDEFLPEVAGFDRALVAASGARIGLILCADHRAAPHSARLARAHFASLGAEVVDDDVVHGAGDRQKDLLYIGGGSPAELLGCLRDDRTAQRIKEHWARGGGLAGSSAGAMALCSHSLVPRPGDTVPTVWSEGLGIVQGIGVAVHASSRPDAWIRQVATDAPVPLLALDDHTGLILRPNADPEVIGPGSAWFVRDL